MDKFQQLLDHYKDKIYEGKYIGYERRNFYHIACRVDNNTCHIVTLNDLIFGQSGFMEALNRCIIGSSYQR